MFERDPSELPTPDHDYDTLARNAEFGYDGFGTLVQAIARMNDVSGKLSRQMLYQPDYPIVFLPQVLCSIRLKSGRYWI